MLAARLTLALLLLAPTLRAVRSEAGEGKASDAEVSEITSKQLTIDGYVKAGDAERAFSAGEAHLQKFPDDVVTLTELALFGVERLKHGDAKYASQADEYGRRAIEMIERDRMPAYFEAGAWREYKTRWLPEIYRSLGTASQLQKRPDEAKVRFTKAAALDPREPFNPFMLGNLASEEFRKEMEQYQAEKSLPARHQSLEGAYAKLDEVIDFYARAAALSEGRPEYQALHDQLMPNLVKYYEYRHKSSAGLREEIDKHRPPR